MSEDDKTYEERLEMISEEIVDILIAHSLSIAAADTVLEKVRERTNWMPVRDWLARTKVEKRISTTSSS